MCAKRCPEANGEICAMCGGTDITVTPWRDVVVSLDACHLGELYSKLLSVFKDRQAMMGLLLDDDDQENLVQKLLEYCDELKELTQLMVRVENDKVTHGDLEYIDCL